MDDPPRVTYRRVSVAVFRGEVYDCAMASREAKPVYDSSMASSTLAPLPDPRNTMPCGCAVPTPENARRPHGFHA